ncbi:NAD(P)/FAD-dependent oxidoreductase [Mitsuokella sp. AF21-1AC]|uniref:NAD(P)/FAD-dependent oxidoreductase n=1 Tax=Mitsuokella sp. AF21-1AC TaxID=2292235 RepID=UPI000E4CD53A|nr:FAD-dependent oxidoreductase [Mitsuokella sp. AF21-1AC]RGS73318.1 FAD-binding protein [Mitsuokella sp. AF21-1AC]
MKTDVLIIGAGPAGVSAALYARRGGLDVTIVTKGIETGGLSQAEKIENYYGFPEPISGRELLRRGAEGARRLGVHFVTGELLGLSFNDTFDGFRGELAADAVEAPAVVLAAGAARRTLPVPGLKEFEGKGVSYCAICDAFFYRGKTVAVVGAGDYALHEAQILLPHAKHVLLLTNGEVPPEVPAGVEVRTEKLLAVEGEDRVSRVVLAGGQQVALQGLFLAIGTAGSSELARKIGAMLDGANVKVDAAQATNVPGLFAAGDCTGGLLQVAKAVHEGAVAGLSVLRYMREKRKAAH